MTPAYESQDVELYEGNKLLDEEFTFFLPTVAAVFGERGAIFLQRLHYLLARPYFMGRRLDTAVWSGRKWVRIEAWMIYDALEGMIPTLSKAAFESLHAALAKDGVLLKTNQLNSDRNDKTNWFALNYSEFTKRIKKHESEVKPLLADRERQRKELDKINATREKKIVWKPDLDWNRILQGVSPQNEDSQNERVGVLRTRTAETLKRGRRHLNTRASTSNTDISIDISTETTGATVQTKSNAVANDVAPSAVDVKSTRVALSEDAQSDSTTPTIEPSKPSPEITPALPGTAAVATPQTVPLDVSRAAHDVAARLQALGTRQDFVLSEDEALQLAATFPETRLDDKHLKLRLGRDHQEAGLDEAIGRVQAARMVEDADALRWMLVTWPGFDEFSNEFYARHIDKKTGKAKWTRQQIFINKWREGDDPPATWLRGHVGEMRQRAKAAREAEQNQRAADVRATLSPEELSVLKRLVQVEFERRQLGFTSDFNEKQKRLHAVEVELLNAPDLRERLAVATSVATSANGTNNGHHAAPELAENADGVAALAATPTRWQPHRNELDRLMRYVKNVLQKLEAEKKADSAFEVSPAAVARLAAQHGGLVADALEWVEDEVLAQWQAEKAKADEPKQEAA